MEKQMNSRKVTCGLKFGSQAFRAIRYRMELPGTAINVTGAQFMVCKILSITRSLSNFVGKFRPQGIPFCLMLTETLHISKYEIF